MTEHRPAILHRLACYVLHRFGEELTARGLRKDAQKDHRIVFQTILFLCGDALRTATPPCDLGLQTTFQIPTPKEPFLPFARLTTIQTVVKQCVDHGWLESPGPKGHATNFMLTSSGKSIALSFPKDLGDYLVPEHRQIVDDLVRHWAGAPAWDLTPALRKVAANAYLEERVVPHYDLSDEGLTPFFEGVARRARSAQA